MDWPKKFEWVTTRVFPTSTNPMSPETTAAVVSDASKVETSAQHKEIDETQGKRTATSKVLIDLTLPPGSTVDNPIVL